MAEYPAGRRAVVTLGPSLPLREAAEIFPKAEFKPPIAAGQAAAWGLTAGDVLVVIDGLFLQSRAVRHKEILDLLDRGVTVIGASSMGALRAAELHQFGMRGVGSVFEDFVSGAIEGDDEVALVHADADNGYTPLGWAMVDLRDALSSAVVSGDVDVDAANTVLAAAKGLPFTQRDSATLIDGARRAGADDEALRRLRVACRRPSGWVKSRDARSALRIAADLSRTQPVVPEQARGHLTYLGTPASYSQTSYTAAWRTSPTDSGLVPARDLLLRTAIETEQFPQVYARVAMECLLLEACGRSAHEDLASARAFLAQELGLRASADGLLPAEALARQLAGRLGELGLPTRLEDADPGLLELLRASERSGGAIPPAVVLATRVWRGDPQYDWAPPLEARLEAAGLLGRGLADLCPAPPPTAVRETVGRLLRHWGVGESRDVLPAVRERGLLDLHELVGAVRNGLGRPPLSESVHADGERVSSR